MRMRTGGMSNPAYYITLLLDIYIYICARRWVHGCCLLMYCARASNTVDCFCLDRPGWKADQGRVMYELHSTVFALLCQGNVPPGATEEIFAQTLFSYSFLPYYNRNFLFFKYIFLPIYSSLGAGDAKLECVAKAIHPVFVFFFVPRFLFRFISVAHSI